MVCMVNSLHTSALLIALKRQRESYQKTGRGVQAIISFVITFYHVYPVHISVTCVCVHCIYDVAQPCVGGCRYVSCGWLLIQLFTAEGFIK